MSYTRSSKHSLKFTNKSKLLDIHTFLDNYKRMVQKYINILWHKYNPIIDSIILLPKMLDSDDCNLINTNVSNDSRIRQCAAKQACSIIKSTLKKRNQQFYKLKELQKLGLNTSYLQRKIDKNIPTRPELTYINAELDNRFIDIQEVNGEFNLFIKITQIGNKVNLKIPVAHYMR